MADNVPLSIFKMMIIAIYSLDDQGIVKNELVLQFLKRR